jgi:hypothetical protein
VWNFEMFLLHIIKKKEEDKIETNLKLIWWEGLEWNNLVHGRDKWLALTNMLIKLRFP